MLKADAADMRGFARLMERAKEWGAAPNEKKGGYLSAGAERDFLSDLSRRRAGWLSAPETNFVGASEKAYQDELAAKKADDDLRRRERDADQARRLVDAAFIARRTRIGLLAAVILAIVVTALGVYSNIQRGEADHQRAEAGRILERFHDYRDDECRMQGDRERAQ